MVNPKSQEINITHSKKCFKCNAIKPLEDFYRHAAMADGRLNKCKYCAKKDAGKHRIDNIERVREYDRERAKSPHRAKLAAGITRIWRAEDKRRQAAHSAVARAVRSGNLTKKPCARCGDEKSVAHHEDYDKKLDVIWLCTPCHKQRHKELNSDAA
jgi:hypothetical protein